MGTVRSKGPPSQATVFLECVLDLKSFRVYGDETVERAERDLGEEGNEVEYSETVEADSVFIRVHWPEENKTHWRWPLGGSITMMEQD